MSDTDRSGWQRALLPLAWAGLLSSRSTEPSRPPERINLCAHFSPPPARLRIPYLTRSRRVHAGLLFLACCMSVLSIACCHMVAGNRASGGGSGGRAATWHRRQWQWRPGVTRHDDRPGEEGFRALACRVCCQIACHYAAAAMGSAAGISLGFSTFPAVDAGCPVLLVFYFAVAPHAGAPDSRLRPASDSAFTIFRRHP